MHPFKDKNIFVRNAWYVGCSTEEIGSKPLERVILNEPVVFYRSEAGVAMAMYGLCPHRAYPLALQGRVVGNALRCNYHGFTFDGRTGACILIPSQPAAPSNYRQKTYKVVERGPWIWIWPGDPALADEREIPSSEMLGFGEGWTYLRPFAFTGIKARYMLLVENLMDLTHLGYLHGDMSSDFEIYVTSPLEIIETEDTFKVVRPMRQGWSETHDVMFKPENRFEGLSDFASITTYYGPGYITTTSHITHAIDSLPTVDKTVYGDVYFHHAVTPATEHSCHYFGTSSRTHRLDDRAFDEAFYPFDAAVRQQDIVAAEAIEARMIQFGEPRTELMAKADIAAARIRRRIQRAIDAETAEARVHQPVAAAF